MEHCRLINENVLCISKALQYCEELCIEEGISLLSLENTLANKCLFETVIKRLNYSVNVCLHCNSESENVKFDIFYYMMSKHFGCEYAVQSPICSFDVIFHLMIINEFTESVKVIGDIAEPADQSIAASKLTNYLKRILNGENETKIESDKVYLFCIQMYISMFDEVNWGKELTTLLESIVFSNFVELSFESYLNDFLDKLFQLFDIMTVSYSQTSTRDTNLEINFPKNFTLFKSAVKFLSYLTNGLNPRIKVQNFKLRNVMATQYLLSFLIIKENSMQEFILFNKFLKKLLIKSDSIEFNAFFIMKNRLYGYLTLIHEQILNKSLQKTFTVEDISILENEVDQLKQPKQLCLIAKILETKFSNKLLKLRFKNLFWNLFIRLDFPQKVECIRLMYEDRDFNEAGKHVMQENFQQETIVLINQLSAENIEDANILSKIAVLMCQSLTKILDELILNALNSSEEIPSICKLFNAFNPLLQMKFNSTPLLLICMKKSLNEVVNRNDEKQFRNYLLFIKALFKINKPGDVQFLNPIEFYENVVKALFVISTQSLKSLCFGIEIYAEMIGKQIKLTVQDLVFMNEVIQFASYKLKLISLHRTSENENVYARLRENAFEMLNHAVNTKLRLNAKDIEWLREYTRCIEWQFGIIFWQVVGFIKLPKSLEDIMDLKAKEEFIVEYYDTKNSSVAELLFMIALNNKLDKFEIKNYGIFNDIKEVVKALVSILSVPRNDNELRNLFKFLFDLITMNHIKTELDEDQPEEKSNSFKFLTLVDLFSFVMFIMRKKEHIERQLVSFTNFLKDELKAEKITGKDMLEIYEYLWIVYYLEKLASVLDGSLSTHIGILIIDIVKNLSKINQDREVLLYENKTKFITDKCLENSFLIENTDQNLKQILIDCLNNI